MLTISQKGIDLISHFEGTVLRSYKALPTEKFFTIGIGHYGSDVSANETITVQEAQDLLKHDLTGVEKGIHALVKVDLNQNQYDALCSFCFNLGVGAFQSSTMLQYINRKKFDLAAEEFPKFCHANNKIIQGLLNRRLAEKQLFETPVPTPKPTSKPKVDIAKPVYHKVVSGDTVSALAKTFGSSVQEIHDWNHLDAKNTIYVTKTIRVK